MIEDRRTEEEKRTTQWFVVATDRFMSGWGQCPGTSYYALACSTLAEAEACEAALRARNEMLRVRRCAKTWRPKLREGDHLAIVGRSRAFPHYDGTIAGESKCSPMGFEPVRHSDHQGDIDRDLRATGEDREMCRQREQDEHERGELH